MGKMRFKKLDMSNDIDKQILLAYFFKKLDRVIDKDELLTMSCIYYDSVQEKISSHTKRFKNELEPYKDTKVLAKHVDDTLKRALSDCLRIQEELVRCDFTVERGIDHFYITVIGADFFMTETELRK